MHVLKLKPDTTNNKIISQASFKVMKIVQLLNLHNIMVMCNLLRISGYTADSVDRSMERIEREIQQLREREKELRYADCYNVLHVDVINNTL